MYRTACLTLKNAKLMAKQIRKKGLKVVIRKVKSGGNHQNKYAIYTYRK